MEIVSLAVIIYLGVNEFLPQPSVFTDRFVRNAKHIYRSTRSAIEQLRAFFIIDAVTATEGRK